MSSSQEHPLTCTALLEVSINGAINNNSVPQDPVTREAIKSI
jgi:hypothetical protein